MADDCKRTVCIRQRLYGEIVRLDADGREVYFAKQSKRSTGNEQQPAPRGSRLSLKEARMEHGCIDYGFFVAFQKLCNDVAAIKAWIDTQTDSDAAMEKVAGDLNQAAGTLTGSLPK